MRLRLAAACAAVVLAAGASQAQPVNQPIDTKALVVQPSQTAANLAAQTIQVVGTTTASTIQGNGFVRTFNALFRKPTPQTSQPSGLPLPSLFPVDGVQELQHAGDADHDEPMSNESLAGTDRMSARA